MALSAFLGNARFTPEELLTRATLTLRQVEGNWTITAIHLDLSGLVPGIDAAKFGEIADRAKAGCPVSRVLRAEITLTKKLEQVTTEASRFELSPFSKERISIRSCRINQ